MDSCRRLPHALPTLPAGYTVDPRNAARALSCHQDVAADAAFSLGMLAEYEASLAQAPWIHCQLFWETGLLGQVLYKDIGLGTALFHTFLDRVLNWHVLCCVFQ